MQNAVRGRAEQQCETVPPMASDNDGVDLGARRDSMYFRFRPSEYQVPVRFQHAGGVAEFIETRLRLFLDLLLHGRQVHGNVAAVDETERFDHVNDVQFRGEQTRQPDRPLAHDARLLGEVDGKQNTLVSTHSIALRRGCGDDTTQ